MSESLYPYYERELSFIRQLAQEFGRKYPATAGRLLLEPNRSVDPHVERLIESFALLAGRIHHKLDNELPELTDALLGVLYPHYLAPIPSLAIVQFDVDGARAPLPDGFRIERSSRLRTRPVGDLPCKFRTTYPVTLWPVVLTDARLQPPPFPSGLKPPPRTVVALRLEFECQGKMNFSDLSLDVLRLYLAGEDQLSANLYELIFNHTLQVVFRTLDAGPAGPQIVLAADQCLKQVGFERAEGLLPYPQRSFPGYLLLTELFTFPAKFLFVDVQGWQRVCQAGAKKKVEVVLFLNRTMRSLEQGVDASTFRLGCTPVVNLFEQVAEPIALTHVRSEYRVVPDVAQPLGTEIYSIDGVSSTDPFTRTTTSYQPFYSFRHGTTRQDQQTFWYAARRPSNHEDDQGTDVFLNLVDLGFNPRLPPATTLVVRTTCTNRDLPSRLQHAGNVAFELEGAAPLQRIQCLRNPTPPLRPALRRGAHWRLISHLNLNYLSISDPVEGRDALQEILRLYDFSDPETESQHLATVTRQLIDGISAVNSRRVVGRVGMGGSSGFCRGVEVTIEFAEQNYIGTGVFLFACVLERFLGLYTSINSFSQLVAKTQKGEGYIKKWPPRAGEQQLL